MNPRPVGRQFVQPIRRRGTDGLGPDAGADVMHVGWLVAAVVIEVRRAGDKVQRQPAGESVYRTAHWAESVSGPDPIDVAAHVVGDNIDTELRYPREQSGFRRSGAAAAQDPTAVHPALVSSIPPS